MNRQLIYLDPSAIWWRDVLRDHLRAARERAKTLLARTYRDGNDCLVTRTVKPAKTRFLGRQVDAYRFIFCVKEEVCAGSDDVVRHRCQNRRCINPEHLRLGTHAENRQDDRDYEANGVDFRYL